jgi:type I restriction enzyme, S subunit
MQVITEKKVVPKLRFGEFKAELQKKQLLEFCKFFSGGTPSSSNREYYKGNIPFIGSGNIYDSEVFKFISEEAFNSSSAKLVEKGDLLYALYGANSGESAISKLEGAINQAILCIRTKESIEYLNYVLVSNKDKIVSKYLQGGQGNLSAQIIKRLKYNMPLLEEQQKIASFLSAVDDKFQQLTKKKELLEKYKKGVMQKIFSQELRFKDDNGNSFPDWEEEMLLDFCKFFSGGTPSSTNKEYYKGNIPFIGSGDIYDTEVFSFISEKAFNSSSAKLVEKGDLLYALYGANSGESAISKLEGAINQAILCIRTKKSIEYLNYVLVLNKGKIVSKYLQGGQGNLSVQIIKRLKYKMPSIGEQQKIANFLSSLDSKIDLVSTQIENSKAFKKGLLQQMFVAA